ncbi:MAG: phosphotransferase family protein [Sphingomonadales bacterium]|nr:phosphotransferase family protein [Sphingomonadales bacterium]
MSDVIVAPETRDLDDLAASLVTWLSERMPAAQGLQVVNLDYPRGAGQSHETILFDVEWRNGYAPMSMGCVVRIKPGSFTVFPDNLFDEQYQIMRRLFEDGRVKIAEPLWIENDPAILGKPFFVMRKIKGRVPVSIPPYAREGWVKDATPAQRRTMWESGVRQLAAIQTVPTAGFDFLAGPAGAERGLAQEWDKYVRFVKWLEDEGATPDYLRALEKGLTRLDSCRPANQPEGLVWGDARLGNMMFGDDFQVLAVMDWEQPSLGGALHDLAWFAEICDTMHGKNCRFAEPLDGMGSFEETVALWEEVSGKSAADLDWYMEFARLKMSCTGVRLGLLRGTYMMTPQDIESRMRI